MRRKETNDLIFTLPWGGLGAQPHKRQDRLRAGDRARKQFSQFQPRGARGALVDANY